MNKQMIVGLVVIAAFIGGVGLLVTNSNGNNKGQKKMNSAVASSIPANTVVMKDLDFGPMKLSVKKGTEVTFSNQDTARHTVTFDDSANTSASSQLIAPGDSYKHTFTQAGTYTYHCTPHPFMKAVIEVTE